MMKKISVSQIVKILGALLITSIFVVITISLYLNQKNIKDATIVNIAGKQRMLTQKITKSVLFLYQTKSNNFIEIDNAISEFNYGLNTLKDGNKLLGISAAPNQHISTQISKVIVLWETFEKNVNDFKSAILENDTQKLAVILNYLTEANNELLTEVDKTVTLYTEYIEEKTTFIKNFQYLSFAFLFIFALYALVQLRQIEAHAREFINKYKKLSSGEIHELEPIEVDSEREFVEMADDMNCFIDKVNSVVNYSQTALEQSELASKKLEGLTEEFEGIINELENKSDIMKQIDMSEDIAIESSENLLKTTQKLNALKKQLEILFESCDVNKLKGDK
jgi:nitrate/nitrite-specific signal transduction histidine kinase